MDERTAQTVAHPFPGSRRQDPPIAGHGYIGDGRAHALVADDGTIDWFALPEHREHVVCDALLDAARGGRFVVAPAEPFVSEQRYRPGSMILDTTFTTGRGTLVITDCFTLHDGAILPWVELVRALRCTRGSVDVAWSLEPNLLFGRPPTGFTSRRGHVQTGADGLRLGLEVWGAGEVVDHDRGVRGQRTMASGQDGLLTAVVTVDGPLPRPDRGEVEGRLDRTVHAWETWSEGIRYDGPWADHVHGSARVLKLLAHEPDGAVIAAPTTSLPERVGGDRNFDYRFCWIRDASFTVDALLRIGLVEEAHRAITALLRMAGRTAPHLAPFYEVTGSVPDDGREVGLAGYRRSTPVRSGNSAHGQLQLGNWGDLFESVWIYVRRGNALDPGSAEVLRRLADQVAGCWEQQDAGIWELPRPRHYTFSKLGCWTALDRAERLADAEQLDGDVDRWRGERDRIRDFVDDRCWSDRRASYRFHAGTDDLDAATLLAARTGFVDGTDPRMLGTIDAVRDELADGPFVWRYSGQRSVEGAFLACSFWLAEALVRAGRLDAAAEQVDAVLAAASPLGLLSEEFDPGTGEQLGNFPQGLSHLAVVNVASLFTEVVRGRGDRP